MSRRRPTALRRTMWPHYEGSMLPIHLARAAVPPEIFAAITEAEGGYLHRPSNGWPNRHDRRRRAAEYRRSA